MDMGQNRFAIEAAHNDQDSTPPSHLTPHVQHKSIETERRLPKSTPYTVTLPRKPVVTPELKKSVHDETEPHSKDTKARSCCVRCASCCKVVNL